MHRGQVRPRAGWYAAAVSLLVIAILTAGCVIVLIADNNSRSDGQGLPGNEPHEVAMDPSRDKVIYAEDRASAGGSPCSATGPGTATFTPAAQAHRIRSGYKYYYLVLELHVSAAGTYHLQCDFRYYFVNYKPSPLDFLYTSWPIVPFALIALSVLFLAAGIIVFLVTLLRRRASAVAQRSSPYPGHGRV